MNIIKQLKLRKLNKERERLLNEFTVEDIEDITVQTFGVLGKSLNNAVKRACLMDGLERLDVEIKAIVEGDKHGK